MFQYYDAIESIPMSKHGFPNDEPLPQHRYHWAHPEDMRLIYAGGHCHAPSCLSIELFRNDTGELLCRQLPVFGGRGASTINGTRFDEPGYIALPPCLFGEEDEGLVPPVFLSWDTNLSSVKRSNSTYGHSGEMASWQMRGVIIEE